MKPEGPARRVPCVGAIIKDQSGCLLLICRGHEPGAGLWSLPGGRVEPGESDADALIRELHEETGLTIRPGPLAGRVERPGPGHDVYEIADYIATVISGELAAGDDATDARWVGLDDLNRLPLTGGLLDSLRGWGIVPGR